MNLFQRRGEKSVPKITTNHSFDQGLSDRSFSKSIKKIYSIFNVHESPDTARRLGENFLYKLYNIMAPRAPWSIVGRTVD